MKDDTRQQILDAGMREFLDKGFVDASLRHIAQLAGVTTGAIYGHWPDKSSLFKALVEPAASEFHNQFLMLEQSFAALSPEVQAAHMSGYSTEALSSLIDYVYAHFDSFRLIACSAAGTEYEHYIDSLVDVEVASMHAFTDVLARQGYVCAPLSENLMHILASAYFSAIFETVAHNMDKEEADAYVEQISLFFHAGWQALMNVA